MIAVEDACFRHSWMALLLCVTATAATRAADTPDAATLIEAVKQQDRSAIARLLGQPVDVNAAAADGATALHWAVYRDDLQTTKSLVAAGAQVDATNDFGITPLSLACTNASAAIVEELLKAGADANATLLTGETSLMTAARSGDLAAVKVLLRHGADVNAKEPVRGQTALIVGPRRNTHRGRPGTDRSRRRHPRNNHTRLHAAALRLPRGRPRGDAATPRQRG